MNASAPARTARPAAAAIAKAAHDRRHAEWQRHERACSLCQMGARCSVNQRLARAADAAGIRWQLADHESRRVLREVGR